MRILVFAAALVALVSSPAAGAEWDAKSLDKEKTLEFRTMHTDGDHWSTVWFVELDGDVYVNLGAPAVKRLTTNTEAPLVSVRIDGEVFDRVRVDAAQEKQPAVADAIAEKYWTGFLIPHRKPSTVMRLRPDETVAPPPAEGAK